jgi:hypothetical protein
VALLAALIPAATMAAQDGEKREYIVTVKVKDSGRSIRPSNRTNKVRIRQRAQAARVKTAEVTKRNGVRARHRYGNVITGFSARMTRAEARKLARDPSVGSVRVARTFRLAGQQVPKGVQRVKAVAGSPANVNAHVAVIDSGIGPAQGNGEPIPMTTDELNIAGGWNCAGTPPTQAAGEEPGVFQARLDAYRGRYGDTQGHGTHVAGTIGARNNDIGAVGVAPGVDLWAVRVFGSSGTTSETNIVCGLDWVLDTHGNALPDIDVVNMSIQGSRIDLVENCGTIKDLALQAESDPSVVYDPMHLAICKLKDIGVPVVASAGNSSMNVNNSAPGGYDTVISVAAMTDTDGVGWEKGGSAGSCYSGERDDTFASYSNFGRDIDIVAPGTCVRSTWYGDPTGDTLVPSTGTSMAAPHVTGAIARYVHAQGRPSSVGEMRQLIRAAGRMDWDAKTDPVWFGVNDTDPPNRVLDVAALTGGNSVKTFLTHQSLNVSGTTASVATRVDVQRGGGYDGQVNLSASGLPGGAGSTSFGDPTLNGLGANVLGTKLTFDLNAGGGEGIYDVTVTSQGDGAGQHPRDIQLTIDRTPPAVAGLSPKVRGQKAGISAKGATQVYLQWNASDNLSGVKTAQLQRKTGAAAWKNAGVGGLASARVYLKPGQSNKFRVKVTDELGNTKRSYAVAARLSLRDSKWGGWNRSGAWKTKPVKKAYGGSLLIATAGQATLKTRFAGKATAIVAPVGNGRGKFRVRVDGGAWQTVNTKTQSAGQRKVVWTAKLANGSHTVEIQRVSGQPALDGLIIVR